MKIGNIALPNQLVLAPMAGVTDLAFRTLCRELGAGYTVTEMVSAKALTFQDKKSLPLMELVEGEHPAGVQLFGSDPVCMEEAAAIVVERTTADIIDINMGCPVPKVTNSGDGSGLMRTPDLAAKVCEAVVKGAGGRPVTVKFRLGWDKGSINCVEFGRMMEGAGAAAVAVHGRTRSQQYAGTANWDYIREVKEALTIPVMANGDIFTPRDAQRILQYTGADAAMIGRGIFGNPWLFQQSAALLAGEAVPDRPPLRDRVALARRQFHMAAVQKGERVACLEARKQFCWYLKGVSHAGYWKEQICKMETLDQLDSITKGIQRELFDET